MMRKWGGDPARQRLAAQVQRLAPGAVLVRVRPDGTVSAYRANRTEIRDRDQEHDARIGQLLRGYYQAVNWVVAHDFVIADGRLCASPRPGQRGTQPAADGTFGSGFGPLYTQGVEIS